jgi:hypothetical protein
VPLTLTLTLTLSHRTCPPHLSPSPPLPHALHAALQALPTEAFIPLSLLDPSPASREPVWGFYPPWRPQHPGWGAVLCGDPRQLGPLVRSRAACAAGLAMSLLEVLSEAHAAEAGRLEQLVRGLCVCVCVCRLLLSGCTQA